MKYSECVQSSEILLSHSQQYNWIYQPTNSLRKIQIIKYKAWQVSNSTYFGTAVLSSGSLLEQEKKEILHANLGTDRPQR